MAEALGLVASLVAVGQALAAVPNVVDALGSIAHASDELADLLNEVRALHFASSNLVLTD